MPHCSRSRQPDPGRIHHAQTAIDFATLLLDPKFLLGWTTKRPIWLERKIVAREAPSFPCGAHLWGHIAGRRSRVWWWGKESRSKCRRTQWLWLNLMAQFASQVPGPLRDHLPAFLPPGR